MSRIWSLLGISLTAFSLNLDGVIVAMMVGSVKVGFEYSRLLCEYSVVYWLGRDIIVFKERSGLLLTEVKEVEDGLSF